MQIEFQAFAYLPKYASLASVVNGKELPLIDLRPDCAYYAKEGYPRIGAVRVIIDLDTRETIVANQIAALQAQLQTVRAENQMRENAILNGISKLQAIGMTPGDDLPSIDTMAIDDGIPF